MANYKEQYLKLFRGTEAAIRCLITAQRECEEEYLASPEPELKVLDPGSYVESEKQKPQGIKKRNVVLLFVALVLAFCLGMAADLAHFVPEPDKCVICGGEAYDAPCLLNVATGKMDEMQGNLTPGLFHFIDCAGIFGAWDSDARSCRVCLPKETEKMDARTFCKACRGLIEENVPGIYAVLDLSVPEEPGIYPVVAGATYHILGQTVLIEDREAEVVLTVFPTEVPLEEAPWNEIEG